MADVNCGQNSSNSTILAEDYQASAQKKLSESALIWAVFADLGTSTNHTCRCAVKQVPWGYKADQMLTLGSNLALSGLLSGGIL